MATPSRGSRPRGHALPGKAGRAPPPKPAGRPLRVRRAQACLRGGARRAPGLPSPSPFPFASRGGPASLTVFLDHPVTHSTDICVGAGHLGMSETGQFQCNFLTSFLSGSSGARGSLPPPSVSSQAPRHPRNRRFREGPRPRRAPPDRKPRRGRGVARRPGRAGPRLPEAAPPPGKARGARGAAAAAPGPRRPARPPVSSQAPGPPPCPRRRRGAARRGGRALRRSPWAPEVRPAPPPSSGRRGERLASWSPRGSGPRAAARPRCSRFGISDSATSRSPWKVVPPVTAAQACPPSLTLHPADSESVASSPRRLRRGPAAPRSLPRGRAAI